VYSGAGGNMNGWQRYTLANVASTPGSGGYLWVPAWFAYIFSGYVCYLFYYEYKHFVEKRLEYLVKGDPDTHQQTHYSLLVENVPPYLRSNPALISFFDNLFPGHVYSVNVVLNLSSLEKLTEERSQVNLYCSFSKL
jgi:hypothetical protein